MAAIVGFSGVVRYTRLACLLAVVVLAAGVFAGASGAAASSTHAKGIDVSNWNGTINWTKVAHAGYRFAIAKATEATNYEDTTYVANRSAQPGRRLGVRRLPLRPPVRLGLAAVTASAVAQADYFLAFATPQPGELPPVLDLEATGNLSRAPATAWTEAWAQEVYARLGVHPLVYSSPAFWQEHLADSTGDRRGRHASLDRALDDREQAVDPRAELERPRLDVLAVDRTAPPCPASRTAPTATA